MISKKLPGSPLSIRAAEWNELADVVNRLSTGQGAGGRAPGVGRGVILDCKNALSSADISQWEIVGIDGFLISQADNGGQFIDGRPTLTTSNALTHATHFARWGIAQRPIPNGKIGPVCIAGATVAKVNMRDAAHRFADVYAATTKAKLDSADYGSGRILAVESGTGEKWALIDIGGLSGAYVGTLGADLSAGSSAAADSSFATIYDDLLATGKKIASGSKIVATWRNGHLYMIGANACPT